MSEYKKFYVNSYYIYNQLRIWAIAYYPELLFYFYDVDLTVDEIDKNREQWLQQTKAINKSEYKKLGDFEDEDEAVFNLIEYYKENANYKMSVANALRQTEYILKMYNMDDNELGGKYTFPVMYTPDEVINKLKWICPIPEIREYLHEQCDVNPKWEWLYNIFWKGEKHFYI